MTAQKSIGAAMEMAIVIGKAQTSTIHVLLFFFYRSAINRGPVPINKAENRGSEHDETSADVHRDMGQGKDGNQKDEELWEMLSNPLVRQLQDFLVGAFFHFLYSPLCTGFFLVLWLQLRWSQY
jgi:hypothetical protein